MDNFKKGEKVIYSVNGVCEITDITEKVFGKTVMRYYVLKPISNNEATLFVPVNNENLVRKMKRLMTQSQLDKVLNDISEKEVEWNSNEVIRKEEFRNTISFGNISEILILLKSIWLHRRTQNSKGRKLHISDEMYLREAEKIIKEEISTVIGVEQDDVIPYVKNKILIRN
ncbi:MAG: CarD family transcriptional regulator [Ruminococcus sp.]